MGERGLLASRIKGIELIRIGFFVLMKLDAKRETEQRGLPQVALPREASILQCLTFKAERQPSMWRRSKLPVCDMSRSRALPFGARGLGEVSFTWGPEEESLLTQSY